MDTEELSSEFGRPDDLMLSSDGKYGKLAEDVAELDEEELEESVLSIATEEDDEPEPDDEDEDEPEPDDEDDDDGNGSVVGILSQQPVQRPPSAQPLY